MAFAIVGVSLYGVYAYIPKATIILSVKQKTKSLDFNVTGEASSTTSDIVNNTIPAKLVSITDDITQSFPASGGSAVSGSQKARGTVTIYNGYSASPQPLVVNTRFLSDSGKLFRLVSSVTVPGSSNNNPGQVDATVIADQPGADYNISSAKFTIPGFAASGDKYTKIYASSSVAMAGGGQSGDAVKTITQNDITNAKNKIGTGSSDEISQKIKDAAGSGMVVCSEAVNIGDTIYKRSNAVGDAVTEFPVDGDYKSQCLVFKEDDLKSMVGNNMAKSSSGQANIDSSSISIDYGKANIDPAKQTIDIVGHATSQLGSGLDMEAFNESISRKK